MLIPERDIMTVKNKQNFLEGSFDDLAILNKSGLMVTEESTLHLVEKAEKKREDTAVMVNGITSRASN
jgi:hypothetical protein